MSIIGFPLYISYSQCSVYSAAGRSHTSGGMERKLVDFYELGDVIGEGGFGSVCAGTCRQNGDAVSGTNTPLCVTCAVCSVYMCTRALKPIVRTELRMHVIPWAFLCYV